MVFEDKLDNNSLIVFLIALGIILVIVALVIVLLVRNNRLNNLVRQNSEYVHAIIAINNKYSFNHVYPTSDSTTFYLKSKRQFDTFDYKKRGSAYISENSQKYGPIINSLENNREMLVKYKEEIGSLKNTSDPSVAGKCKMKLNKFVKREIKIGSKLIKRPQTNFFIIIKWKYTSPAGRNSYSNDITFGYDIIKHLVMPQTQVFTKTVKSQRPKPKSRSKLSEPLVSFDDIPNIDD